VRRRLTSALWAGLIVAIGAFGTFAQIGTVGSEGLLPSIAAAPVVPGFYAALFLGLGRGAHGFPSHEDAAPYLIAFLLWWVVIDRSRAWFQQRKPRTSPST
jgi:hypothetical protein